MAILQKTLPQEQLIQVHYFCDTEINVALWLKTFPNVHFSVGGVASQFKPWQIDGVKSIPRGRLLLETDAPYAPVHGIYSTPFGITAVAQTLAKYLGITAREVLAQTTANAIRFFQLEDP